ncbi:hypothetical protein CHS0354_016155, partial [Potamilus streckersoni]
LSYQVSGPTTRKLIVKVQAKLYPTSRTRMTHVLAAKKCKRNSDSDNEAGPSSEDDIARDAYHDSEYEPHSDTDDEVDSVGSSDFQDQYRKYKIDKDAKPYDKQQFLVSESDWHN